MHYFAPSEMAGLAQGMDRNEAIQFAAASGHGVGKSTLVAWIILWAISTFEDTRGVCPVTALGSGRIGRIALYPSIRPSRPRAGFLH